MSPFQWYVAAVGGWFLAFGLQSVVVSTIVAMELEGSSTAMAATQMAQQLPGFGLVLLGGAVADRVDRRALLIGLYLAAALLAAALGAGAAAERLSLPVVIGYVLAMGTITAFPMPSRDAMVSDLVAGNLMRAITTLTISQFVMQAVGSSFGVAGRARLRREAVCCGSSAEGWTCSSSACKETISCSVSMACLGTTAAPSLE